MKGYYAKLISDGTWYVEGTEVLYQGTFGKDNFQARRLTVVEYIDYISECQGCGFIGYGIRIPDDDYKDEIKFFGKEPMLDGEQCHMTEFSVTWVEDDLEIPHGMSDKEIMMLLQRK